MKEMKKDMECVEKYQERNEEYEIEEMENGEEVLVEKKMEKKVEDERRVIECEREKGSKIVIG